MCLLCGTPKSRELSGYYADLNIHLGWCKVRPVKTFQRIWLVRKLATEISSKLDKWPNVGAASVNFYKNKRNALGNPLDLIESCFVGLELAKIRMATALLEPMIRDHRYERESWR